MQETPARSLFRKQTPKFTHDMAKRNPKKYSNRKSRVWKKEKGRGRIWETKEKANGIFQVRDEPGFD